jgi:aldehyde:ferredoxin oxidoreductase
MIDSLRREVGEKNIWVLSIHPKEGTGYGAATLYDSIYPAGPAPGIAEELEAKSIVAIVVSADKPVRVKKPNRFLQLCVDLGIRLLRDPVFDLLSTKGTQALGRPFKDLSYISSEPLHNKSSISYRRIRRACFTCPIGCRHLIQQQLLLRNSSRIWVPVEDLWFTEIMSGECTNHNQLVDDLLERPYSSIQRLAQNVCPYDTDPFKPLARFILKRKKDEVHLHPIAASDTQIRTEQAAMVEIRRAVAGVAGLCPFFLAYRPVIGSNELSDLLNLLTGRTDGKASLEQAARETIDIEVGLNRCGSNSQSIINSELQLGRHLPGEGR